MVFIEMVDFGTGVEQELSLSAERTYASDRITIEYFTTSVKVDNNEVFSFRDYREAFNVAAVYAHDYDNDGDMDIMLGDSENPFFTDLNGKRYVVLVNDGEGNFTAEKKGNFALNSDYL